MQTLADRVQAAKGIRCSHCGADLVFNAELQAVACNFCGHHLSLEDLKQVETIKPDGIVPFSTSKEAFTASALSWLIEGKHVPNDVLDKAGSAENLGIYIPTVSYRGSYTADWNCQVGVDRQEQELVRINGKLQSRTRRWVEWHPQSGRTHGAYRFLACGSTVLPDPLKRFVEQIQLKDVRAYDERILLGFAQEHITSELDPSALFNSRVEPQLNALIEQSVRGQISASHVKDIRYSHLNNPETPVRLQIPIWLLTYDYDGTQHRIIADGGNVAEITGSRPVDLERKKRLDRPVYFAGGIVGAGLALAVAGAGAHQPIIGDLAGGVVTGGLSFLGATLIHRSRELNLSGRVRREALAAYHAKAAFDVSAELEKRRRGALGGTRFLQTTSIAAGIVGVTAALLLFLRPNSMEPPAPQMAPAAEPAVAEASPTPQATKPADVAASTSPSDASSGPPAAGSGDDATTPPQTAAPSQTPAQTAAPQSPKPAAQPEQSTPSAPVMGSQEQDLINYSTEQVKECLRTQNLDCAESNLKIILKLQPDRADAVNLLNQIQDERRKAFAGSWNAR